MNRPNVPAADSAADTAADAPNTSAGSGGARTRQPEPTRFERFDLRTIAAQPWKNGAGVTRQIAVAPADAGVDDFDWRISVAEVERDAPFSAFEGVDRCIVLLRGAGMRLKSAGGEVDHRLDEPLAPFRFPGDVPLQATLIGGACSDFNVMTRRGAWRSEAVVHSAAFDALASDVFVLLCVEGAWQVSGVTQVIASMQGAVWRAADEPLHIQPIGPGPGRVLVVRLCHDRPA